jgi:hypothetical protein
MGHREWEEPSVDPLDTPSFGRDGLGRRGGLADERVALIAGAPQLSGTGETDGADAAGSRRHEIKRAPCAGSWGDGWVFLGR